MPTVTVQGAHASTVTLSYDSSANASLAAIVANAIKTDILGGSVIPADSAFGGPPPIPSGKTGEWIQSTPGVNTLPHGYDFIVATASFANLTGPSDANVQVLAGSGQLIFNAAGGSGRVIAGGGNDQVVIPVAGPGAWNIVLGNGNDTIKALGHGNDTISVGAGSDSIMLGSGNSVVTTSGAATITASNGNETVTGFGSNVIFGGGSGLSFVAGGGATVFGGSGSDTVTGGSGPDEFHGGTAGNNSLTAGSGAATLFGGGNGDRLFASGSGAQILFAAGGNETLSGSSAPGAHDTMVGGSGHTTIVASPVATNLFEFVSGMAGTDIVQGLSLTSQVDIHLSGFGAGEVANAVATQNNGGGSTVIGLTDGTTITFQNVPSLTAGNFT